MPKLTATTPLGTFTRDTHSPYRFVAIITMKDGSDVRQVGAAWKRKEKAMARWSTTAAGAVKNAETYPYMQRETFTVHGPYPVDGTAAAPAVAATKPKGPTAAQAAAAYYADRYRRPYRRLTVAQVRAERRQAQIDFARSINAGGK